ncbi:hypothetical protein [Rhizobium sp. NXC24]|uniref:hypothetical protein n=1 Tax=Rhizobium sp. NXC24 TaxID=2048897 RepID=UPI000CDF47B0|nr:hypothetical protein [Rhizobium sp. NXC24]AVA23883.1 hypothetical protein NXC24_PA00240 [Rhizobium sp. NXC24]
MSQIINLPITKPAQTDSVVMSASADASCQADLLRQFEGERRKILNLTNYLEALYARLLIASTNDPAVSPVTSNALLYKPQ